MSTSKNCFRFGKTSFGKIKIAMLLRCTKNDRDLVLGRNDDDDDDDDNLATMQLCSPEIANDPN